MTALAPRLLAEAVGTGLLVAAVIGSGIMGQVLSGIPALGLLTNAIATGAALFVLIRALGPVSGAHLNPAVSLLLALKGELQRGEFFAYVAAQCAGALSGMLLAHAMFELPLLQLALQPRAGLGQWLSEAVATGGLLGTILLLRRDGPNVVAAGVALYIVSAYWFTASTSFANPAVTLGRMWTDSFSGIRPLDGLWFILIQLGTSAVLAALLTGIGRRSTPGGVGVVE